MISKQLFQATLLTLLLLASFGCTSTTKTMNSKKTCELTPLKRSQEILTVILNDIPTHYTHVGAGITGIKLSATNVYVISIAQEERIDQLTYEVAVDENCEIKILSRELNAISPWDND